LFTSRPNEDQQILFTSRPNEDQQILAVSLTVVFVTFPFKQEPVAVPCKQTTPRPAGNSPVRLAERCQTNRSRGIQNENVLTFPFSSDCWCFVCIQLFTLRSLHAAAFLGFLLLLAGLTGRFAARLEAQKLFSFVRHV
jgi:hypothetical protein